MVSIVSMIDKSMSRAAAAALLAALSACAPAGTRVDVAAFPDPAAALGPSAQVVDPPMQPGTPVAAVRDADPRPVVYYQQPAKISPPGEPTLLPPPIPHGDRQLTLVEAVSTRLDRATGATDRRRLAGLLYQVARGRPDALHLEVRGGDRGAVRSVIRTAIRAGVDPLKIRVVPADGAIEVIATRYVASAPICPSLAIVGPSVIDNAFEPTLGCSTRQNLAVIVNDPAELLGDEAVVPADGARAAAGIEHYRNRGSGQGGSGASGASAPNTGTRTSGGGLSGLGDGPVGGAVVGPGGPV